MVGRWHGSALHDRSSCMPIRSPSYAYRWLGGIAPRRASSIARSAGSGDIFAGLGRMFDTVVCANSQLAGRLATGGVERTRDDPDGRRAGAVLAITSIIAASTSGARGARSDADGLLLLGVGRFSAEKRWDMVLRAAGECGRKLPVGLLLVGDGPRRQKLEMIAQQYRNVSVLPPITDRTELASLLASADALVHGCESETFCLVAAEARASGMPLIVPDRGAAVDQLVEGAGTTYRGGQRTIARAGDRRASSGADRSCSAQPRLRSSRTRTMDEHFADLFARYQALSPQACRRPCGACGRRLSWLPDAAEPPRSRSDFP